MRALSLFLFLASLARAQDTPCFTASFSPLPPSRSADRRAAVDDCTRLILADPKDPRPFLYRGDARWLGPDPAHGWNQRPYYDLKVAEDPDPVISDYESALERSRARPIQDPGAVRLRLGYLRASKGEWALAARAWLEASGDPGVAREARERLHFARARLVSADRLLASPPGRCEGLPFWDCALVRGCSLVLEGADRAFHGCAGKPQGLEPGVRPASLDCGLLDESFCAQTPRCRWKTGRLKAAGCVGAG